MGSYPTFSPLPAKALLKDDKQVSLPPVTAAYFRGGRFSVALSVNHSTGFSLCSSRFRRCCSSGFTPLPVGPREVTDSSLCYSSPGVTRRVAHLSLHVRPQSGRLTQTGVRTFLPSRRFGTSDRPAHPPVLLYSNLNGLMVRPQQHFTASHGTSPARPRNHARDAGTRPAVFRRSQIRG